MNEKSSIRKIFSPSYSFCITTAIKYHELIEEVNDTKELSIERDKHLLSNTTNNNNICTRMANAPNLVGFEDGNWYKIRNVGDNSIVQLAESGNKLICMPEDTEGNQDLQRFRAIMQPSGKFRIVPKLQKSPSVVQVWDYLPHREALMQRKQSPTDKFTQNWTSEYVPGFNSLYLIQSGPSPQAQKCLKNMGEGEQIRVIKKSNDCIGDSFAHWNLELQDLPS